MSSYSVITDADTYCNTCILHDFVHSLLNVLIQTNQEIKPLPRHAYWDHRRVVDVTLWGMLQLAVAFMLIVFSMSVYF